MHGQGNMIPFRTSRGAKFSRNKGLLFIGNGLMHAVYLGGKKKKITFADDCTARNIPRSSGKIDSSSSTATGALNYFIQLCRIDVHKSSPVCWRNAASNVINQVDWCIYAGLMAGINKNTFSPWRRVPNASQST